MTIKCPPSAVLAFIFGAALALASCSGGERIGGPLIVEVDTTSPRSILATVNENAQKCWIRSGSRQFRALSVIPELDTGVGNPRLLVVGRGKGGGLPKLVIEASGDPVKITTYGPLASAGVSARINDDVIAWSAGKTGC
ncbi:hypothetical protein [Oricola sp.]|uniref:hypothetical protein n=1 Tax=Oricola sp. TaxID=1979950 RepID=UPI003BA8F4F7